MSATQAKVTQAQADAYSDGFAARHRFIALDIALAESGYSRSKDLKQCFRAGYEDCGNGTLNFEKIMGPNDFEPDVP